MRVLHFIILVVCFHASSFALSAFSRRFICAICAFSMRLLRDSFFSLTRLKVIVACPAFFLVSGHFLYVPCLWFCVFSACSMFVLGAFFVCFACVPCVFKRGVA